MATKSFEQAAVLGLYTETPLHCGAESGVGYVDLPVQRERHTRYPVIPGSTLKGRLKDETDPKKGGKLGEKEHEAAFGSMNDQTRETKPGRISFGDALLVAFPVRSADVPYRWATSPLALERVGRLLGEKSWVGSPGEGEAWVRGAVDGGEVLLEEVVLTAVAKPERYEAGVLPLLLELLPDEEQGFGYTREIFLGQLTIVPDAIFSELVETGTDVITRIKLNALGTTVNLEGPKYDHLSADDRKGNLFVEEVVPAETLFAAALRNGGGPVDELVAAIPAVLQLGGDETIGRGVCHVRRWRR